VPRYGAIGAAYALLINAATQGPVFVYIVQRRFVGVPLPTMLSRAAARPLLAGLVILAYGVLVAPHVHRLLTVLLAMALGGILYLGITAVLGVWDQRELAVARSLMESARRRIAALWPRRTSVDPH